MHALAPGAAIADGLLATAPRRPTPTASLTAAIAALALRTARPGRAVGAARISSRSAVRDGSEAHVDREFRHCRNFQRPLQQPLDIAQQRRLIRGDQRDRLAGEAGA